MNQMYATYLRHLFLFNVQQLNEHEWIVYYGKTYLLPLVADLMQLTFKTINSQIKTCILWLL
jgi:hypothetical protein